MTVAAQGEGPARAVLLSPFRRSAWYATAAIALGLLVGVIAAGVVYSAISSGLSTLLFGFGLVFIALGIEASRVFAAIERRRTYLGQPAHPPAHPYRPLRGSFVDLLRAEFTDPNRWRDVLYVAVNLPLSLIEFIVVLTVWALSAGLITIGIWYPVYVGSPLPQMLVLVAVVAGVAFVPVATALAELVMSLQRGVVASLLCTSPERELRREVEALRSSRAALLDAEATELHRIERDLHDGAQQRLISLAMDLALAEEKLDTDPAAARELVAHGREQARLALTDIRELVRGIAPSILLDRGLVAAIESISGQGPVPTTMDSSLEPGERLPLAVERTAYFVVAEALANAGKHGGARHCVVRIGRTGDRLVVEVQDDGHGGAQAGLKGGLAGLAGRVEGVEGVLTVSSPAGGPTVVRAVLPVRYESR